MKKDRGQKAAEDLRFGCDVGRQGHWVASSLESRPQARITTIPSAKRVLATAPPRRLACHVGLAKAANRSAEPVPE